MAKKQPAKNGAGGTVVDKAKRPARGKEGTRDLPRLKELTDRLKESLAELQRSEERIEKALADLVAETSTGHGPGAVHRRLKVKVMIYPDENGGYTAVLPALPGCITEAETREELLANLREALEGHLLSTSGAFEPLEGGVEEEIEL